jgi:hypothetical protein
MNWAPAATDKSLFFIRKRKNKNRMVPDFGTVEEIDPDGRRNGLRYPGGHIWLLLPRADFRCRASNSL